MPGYPQMARLFPASIIDISPAIAAACAPSASLHKQLATPSRGSPTLQITYVLFAESLCPLYASFMRNLLLFTCKGSEQTRGGSDGKRLCQRLLDACRSFDVTRGASGRGTGVMAAERAQGFCYGHENSCLAKLFLFPRQNLLL